MPKTTDPIMARMKWPMPRSFPIQLWILSRWKLRNARHRDMGTVLVTMRGGAQWRVFKDVLIVQLMNGKWRKRTVLVDAAVAELSGDVAQHRAEKLRDVLDQLAPRHPVALRSPSAAARRN